MHSIDVPRPLTNDLWVFLFQTIDDFTVLLFLTLTTVNSKLKLEGFEITIEQNCFNMCGLRMYRLALLSKEHAFKHFARCD